MDYSEALAYVAGLSHRGWRLGLDRMEEFLRRANLESSVLGSPHGPDFIHVAGTNGKGSVTAYVESMLRHSGRRTGAFFSPFVYDIRERIQSNGKIISKEDLIRLTERLAPVSDGLEATHFGGATEFEFKTALAFAYWQELGLEWVALEVGLGGRLDATNVVQPRCSAIVTIGLDHTAILGETYTEIATEKAGILKPGVPAVLGRMPTEAEATIVRIARERGCPVRKLGQDFRSHADSDATWTVEVEGRTIPGCPLPLPGRHQADNVAVAVAALVAAGVEASDESIRNGLAHASIPGRFERRYLDGRLVLLDGAHNTESMAALCETLRERYPDQLFDVVFAMVQGHDPKPVIRHLESVVAEAHICPVDFHRTQMPEDLAPYFRVSASIHRDSADAISSALGHETGRPILVTGSFYLVGEVGNWLSRKSCERQDQ